MLETDFSKEILCGCSPDVFLWTISSIFYIETSLIVKKIKCN